MDTGKVVMQHKERYEMPESHGVELSFCNAILNGSNTAHIEDTEDEEWIL